MGLSPETPDSLYRVTKQQQAHPAVYQDRLIRTRTMPPLPGFFPDQLPPFTGSGPNGCELLPMRPGLSLPAFGVGKPSREEHPQHGVELLASPNGAGEAVRYELP